MQLNELYAKMTTEEVVEAIAKDAVEMLDRMVVRHKKALDENPYYPHTHTHPHS